jgi:cytoskeletal protein CcmA (bactofilin family)
MAVKRRRLPPYATVIGPGTEITGDVRFQGCLHIDGRVSGDVIGHADRGCALTLGTAGVVEGNLTVAHVILDGTVVGDVRAAERAELASGARIEGTVYYGVLEMDEGAEVNGKLVHLDGAETLRLEYQRSESSGEAAGGGADGTDSVPKP